MDDEERILEAIKLSFRELGLVDTRLLPSSGEDGAGMRGGGVVIKSSGT